MFDRTSEAIGAQITPRAARAIDINPMIQGAPVADVAELLPRIFNLCRTAQDVAGRMALGMPVPGDAHDALCREILRDHMQKLLVRWPAQMGMATRQLPDLANVTDVRAALFGHRDAPRNTSEWGAFRASDAGVAPVFAGIAARFAHQEAVVSDLPLVTTASALDQTAQENSAASRNARHPAMIAIEASHGRGPVWRAFARVIDTLACLENALPLPRYHGKVALVPATRGLYAVSADVRDGAAQSLTRTTPTDHLLATGGVMEQSFATLRAENERAAGLLIDILDPTTPISLEKSYA